MVSMAAEEQRPQSPSPSPPSSYIVALLGGGLGSLKLEEKSNGDLSGEGNKDYSLPLNPPPPLVSIADEQKLQSSPQSPSYIAAVLNGGLGSLRLEEESNEDVSLQEKKGSGEGNKGHSLPLNLPPFLSPTVVSIVEEEKPQPSPQSPSPPSSYIAALLSGELGSLKLEEKLNGDVPLQEKKGLGEGNADSEKDPRPSKDEQSEGKFQYPLRPYEPDCAYYLRNGYCRFGLHCKFNHPLDRGRNQVTNENSESVGLVECKFYLLPGGCRHGKACKYRHYRNKTERAQVELNSLGLPLRPGQPKCLYYIRNGFCIYSTSCKLHHPQPTAVGGALPGHGGALPGHQNGGSPQGPTLGASQLPETSQPSSLTTSQLDSGFATSHSNMLAMLSPRQSPQPNPDWTGYQLIHGKMAPAAISSSQSESYVQHPPDPTPNSPTTFEKFPIKASDASPVGLPLRPEQPICMYYKNFGVCKYGHSCKSDHPMDYALFPVSEAAGSSERFHPPAHRRNKMKA